MAKFDFRILLETVQGHKTSYISQSFVDTDVDLVLSSSQVFDRIGNSISCSYQNFIDFSGSDFKPNDKFSDNNLLNISLIGGDNPGSMILMLLMINMIDFYVINFLVKKFVMC